MRKREQFRALRAAYDARQYLLKIPDVLGYGVGYRERNGQRTDEPALIVYVKRGRKRHAKDEIPRHRRIPERLRWEIDGEPVWLPVDLVEVDEGSLQATAGAAANAVRGGLSIGNRSSAAETGTIGWITHRASDGALVLCSCYHVLLPLSPGSSTIVEKVFRGDPAKPEEATVPGRGDGGDINSDVVAEIVRGERNELLDIAIAVPTRADRPFQQQVANVGAIGAAREITASEVTAAPSPIRVKLRGSVSDVQQGIITEYPSQFRFRYPDLLNPLLIVDLIATDLSTARGDSGAALLDENNRPLGMLVGGTGSARSFFMHIANIRTAMQLRNV